VDRAYQGKTGRIAVTVKIDEGPQWLVEKLAVEGITQVNRDEVTAGLASAGGQPFADTNLAFDRNQILAYYFERGFPNANLKSSWQPAGDPTMSMWSTQ